MAKKKKKKKGKKNQSLVQNANERSNEGEIHWDSLPNIKRKEFDNKLRPLHVELVKLQEWVKAALYSLPACCGGSGPVRSQLVQPGRR
jgi:hypothetical protein